MAAPQPLVVLFDGGCPMCRGTVRTLQRLDWLHRLQFANAMDDGIRARVAPALTQHDVMQQMYVVDGHGRIAGGYDAQLRIGRRVPVLWILGVLGALPGVRQIGARIYRYIAANRRRQGVCSDELCSPQFRPR